MAGRLPYDILVQVVEVISDDYLSLYSCSLVNWDFNLATSRILYARIEYSPSYRHVLDLRDGGTLAERPMLASACSPRNAPLVLQLEIKGFVSTRTSPSFVLSTTIAEAIKKFINLSKITFCPLTFSGSLFVESLELLPQLLHLRELAVNRSCMTDQTVPLLTQIGGLRRLTLSSPGRIILDSLSDWLERLSPYLTGLHFRDNCGSITPGVLRSFLPHIQGSLRGVTLGLSYSLTDEDVFSFLAQLPHLERLQLQYYLQMRSPKTYPNLTRLKSFAVDYVSTSIRHEVLAICKWIKRVISRSPIEHIHLISGYEPEENISNVPFDSIVDHLVRKHSATLRILNFSNTYVGVDAAKALFIGCLQLEQVYISGRKRVLDTFQTYSPHLHRLHTAGFNIRNAKMKRSLVDDELAANIISQGPPSFRRLLVNGAKWEVCSSRNSVVHRLDQFCRDRGCQKTMAMFVLL
ncbi:hypothetical protein FPV67DRAFT_1654305 [Lyophyllum atratum]|nr:hypothetical protein FPV67DRAFT_1654305 [Lyophyllum atratum]